MASAEILRDHHCGAGGDAHKENQKKVQDRSAGSYSRQRRIADIFTHNDGIHRIIKLLSQIAYQKRNGKLNQTIERFSLGQILRSKKR